MTTLVQHAVSVVLWLAFATFAVTILLVLLTLWRRVQREKAFRAVDELRDRYGTIFDAVAAGTLEHSAAARVLQEARHAYGEGALEGLLIEKARAAERPEVFCDVAWELGLVERWQARLRGQVDAIPLGESLARAGDRLEHTSKLQFLVRARSAENLGTVRHRPSWPLIAAALDDSHPDVASAAARSLAAISEPASFPALIERLHALVLGRSGTLSLRSLTSALGSFSLELAVELAPSLTHPHPRIRFLAVDIIRDMTERQANARGGSARVLPSSLGEIFLTRLIRDANPDVRARAAAVMAHVDDPRAGPSLAKMAGDETWFVRLHALRALARRGDLGCVEVAARRLTDPHWRVREAAVSALLSLGASGLNTLLDRFVATQDEYSQEQTAEQIERAGLVPEILRQWGGTGAPREGRFLARLAEIGRTNALIGALNDGLGPQAHAKVLEQLRRHLPFTPAPSRPASPVAKRSTQPATEPWRGKHGSSEPRRL